MFTVYVCSGSHSPAGKRSKLFAHYSSQSTAASSCIVTAEQQLRKYLENINDADFDSDLQALFTGSQYTAIKPLIEFFFCVPATSAPVERVFSQSGLVMRPHRARMSDSLLETLVFLKCNSSWM